MSGIEGAEIAVGASAERMEPPGSARQPAAQTNPRGTPHDAFGHLSCRGMSFYSDLSGKGRRNLLKDQGRSSLIRMAPLLH